MQSELNITAVLPTSTTLVPVLVAGIMADKSIQAIVFEQGRSGASQQLMLIGETWYNIDDTSIAHSPAAVEATLMKCLDNRHYTSLISVYVAR